jgi:acetylornithine aminotransferase
LAGVAGVRDVRGRGLLIGIELHPGGGVEAAVEALGQGVLVLPAGDQGEVVELSPPVCLTRDQERAALEVVARSVRTVARSG